MHCAAAVLPLLHLFEQGIILHKIETIVAPDIVTGAHFHSSQFSQPCLFNIGKNECNHAHTRACVTRCRAPCLSLLRLQGGLLLRSQALLDRQCMHSLQLLRKDSVYLQAHSGACHFTKATLCLINSLCAECLKNIPCGAAAATPSLQTAATQPPPQRTPRTCTGMVIRAPQHCMQQVQAQMLSRTRASLTRRRYPRPSAPVQPCPLRPLAAAYSYK